MRDLLGPSPRAALITRVADEMSTNYGSIHDRRLLAGLMVDVAVSPDLPTVRALLRELNDLERRLAHSLRPQDFGIDFLRR